jgi:hypothetical protein
MCCKEEGEQQEQQEKKGSVNVLKVHYLRKVNEGLENKKPRMQCKRGFHKPNYEKTTYLTCLFRHVLPSTTD